jgi:transcriptional regulator with XRE-family HTH domain
MSNALRAYRDRNGLSQEDVAERLGISRSMVGLLENGAREFTAAMAIRIETRLGIDRLLIRPDLFRRKAA